MVTLVTSHNRSRHSRIMFDMHRDRKRVFVDMLRWDVPHDDTTEIDQFDDDHAEYLIVTDPATGEHQGSLRLLRTDRPHILGSLFPQLCAREVPCGADIREITRLCLSPRLRARGRLAARNALARSLVEYGLMTGVRAYTGVADMGWLSQILSAGWDCRPLGLPQPFGSQQYGAMIIHVGPDTLGRFAEGWRCPSPAPRILMMDEALAA